MSFAFYCILFGILVVFPETDGNQLTWNEPLPILTVQESDANQVVHRNHTRLTEGTINASLSWYFNLSSGLFFNSLNLKLKTDVIAVVNSRRKEVLEGFRDKYAINWIPSQRITLLIFNVTTEQNATFACEVFAIDTFTSIWRSHVQVDVVAPPSNIKTSSDQNVTAPAQLTLTCSADGKPTPTTTWTRVSDNTDVYMPLNITGGKSNESYRCTADNNVGNPLTKVVNIYILSPPSNIIVSSGQNITAPAALTLNCSADGRPTPTITWTRISDNTDVYMPLNITGGRNAESYKCTADNGVGKPLFKVVIIHILYKPDHVSLNFSTKVCAGTKVTFTCSASGANPSIQHYTLYNSVAGLAKNRSNQLGVFNETLLIEGLHNYRCEASNSVGNTSSQDRTIEVQITGSIRIASSKIHVLEGASISVHCNFSGFHSQHVSWTNASNHKVEAGNILKFHNISRHYHGEYNCSGSNVCGGDSKRVSIDVQYPVGATRKGQNSCVLEGKSEKLTCPVAGNPEPKITWYNSSEAVISSEKEVEVEKGGCYICVASNSIGASVNITECLIVRRGTCNTTTPSTTAPDSGTPWVIIGGVVGGVVLLAISVGVSTWWVQKQRKCRKDTKIHNSDLRRHDNEGGYSQVQGAYAQSGPPAANGTDGTAGQEIEVAAAAIPTYAVVDNSKKDKKQADEKPPEYAVVDKSKKEKQEAAAIPTYAAVDKSKKKKKLCEEVPAVYAEVDKSKKKKKRTNDKNPYENLDETKKEKKPGELLYADLGDFQNPGMPTVCISPQPLPAIKKADPYERTDYADITQFLKGNTTLPPNDGNGDTEMKPKRPSKRNVQGNDKETPI